MTVMLCYFSLELKTQNAIKNIIIGFKEKLNENYLVPTIEKLWTEFENIFENSMVKCKARFHSNWIWVFWIHSLTILKRNVYELGTWSANHPLILIVIYFRANWYPNLLVIKLKLLSFDSWVKRIECEYYLMSILI